VEEIGSDRPLRIVEPATVSGKENVVVAIQENFERGLIVRHATLGRCDDSCVPSHHVIA
jgi:hypothetical protein